MDKYELKNKVLRCIDKIYSDDCDLFQRGNYEVTITCKLSQYLYWEFLGYNVDCEYNKHIENQKELDWDIVRPDIVIHKRWHDQNNLVCIEAKKKTNSRDRQSDIKKLKDFTHLSSGYCYKLWIFIDFWLDNPTIRYFMNGKEVNL